MNAPAAPPTSSSSSAARLARGVGVLLFVLILAVAAWAATRNLPYYHYVDEGHMVRWNGSIFRAKAPPNIFYGPLLYDVLALLGLIVDGFALLTGGDATYWTGDRLTRSVIPTAYDQDFAPTWVLLGVRLVSVASFGVAAAAVGRLCAARLGELWGWGAALLVASFPLYADFAAFAQPEMAIAAVGALLLAHVVRHENDGFGRRETVILGLFVVALSGLKIYTLVYAGFGLLTLLRPAGGRWTERALLLTLTIGGGAVLLYLPYRTPMQMLDVIQWAHQYYAQKPPGSLLEAMFVDGRAFLPVHGALFAVGLYAAIRRALPLPVALAGVLAIVNVAYFARLPFANTRNVVLVGVIGAVWAAYGLRAIARDLPERARPWVARGFVAVAAGLAIWTTVWSLGRMPDRTDSRLVVTRELRARLPSGGRIYVATEAQMHRSAFPDDAWVDISQRSPPPDDEPAPRKGDLVLVRGNGVAVTEARAAWMEAAREVLHQQGAGNTYLRRETFDPEILVYEFR